MSTVREFFDVGSDEDDKDVNEYMEKQSTSDGKDSLLYIHQGFYATVLLTKEEAFKLKEFIEKNF